MGSEDEGEDEEDEVKNPTDAGFEVESRFNFNAKRGWFDQVAR